MKKMCLAALVCSCSVGSALGQVYDVTADWSSTSNPSGRWSYQHGDLLLPRVDSWQRTLGGWSVAQPGWSRSEDSNTRLPFWFKSNGSETFPRDFLAGDVVVHTMSPDNGVGSGIAVLEWTSPGDGVVDIEGAVWIGREIGRQANWAVKKGCYVYASGKVESGDAYSRANPMTFESHASSPGSLNNIPVRANSEIRLELPTVGGPGEFAGVRMKITFTAIEPGCRVDFDGDGFITFEDFDAFVTSFEAGSDSSDFNADGCLDFTDFDDFVTALEAGC
jgi:hypothetical protein